MPFDIDAVFEALADATRRDIFERIVVRPARVNELASQLPVTRPAVSHHLQVLRDAGLVRQDGLFVEPVIETLPAVRLYFDRLWLEASLGDAWLLQRAKRLAS